jgi:peptide/nickel transport system substrate-binding protein
LGYPLLRQRSRIWQTCLLGVVLGLALLHSAVGCRRAAGPAERPLEVVVPLDVATLDPRHATRSLDVKLTRLVHAGLFGLNPETLRPEPLLAESFRFEGERRLVVELKRGVRFHGGTPFGADDVCATIAAVADPALGSPHRPIVGAIGSCRAPQSGTVVIELAEPRATLLSDLELPILRADQARSAPEPDGGLDGLGPYRIASVNRGEIVLLPQGGGALPAPRHAVTVRTVRDENARALRLLAGESDIAPNAISPALLPALAGRGRAWINARPGANVTYLLFQNDRAPFNRVEVRRAIAHAIDRDELVRTLLAGRAQVARWLMPPGHWSSPATLPGYNHLPQAARPVLARLGPITLLTGTDRLRVTLARAIAQMLGDCGLEVRVIALDFGVLLHRLDAGDFDLAMLQMPELTEPNVLNWFFNVRGIPGEGGEGRNRARYRSAEASALLDRASEVSEPKLRTELYAHVAEVMLRDLPVVPLWHEDQIAVVSSRARAFQLSAEGRWLGLASIP